MISTLQPKIPNFQQTFPRNQNSGRWRITDPMEKEELSGPFPEPFQNSGKHREDERSRKNIPASREDPSPIQTPAGIKLWMIPEPFPFFFLRDKNSRHNSGIGSLGRLGWEWEKRTGQIQLISLQKRIWDGVSRLIFWESPADPHKSSLNPEILGFSGMNPDNNARLSTEKADFGNFKLWTHL